MYADGFLSAEAQVSKLLPTSGVEFVDGKKSADAAILAKLLRTRRKHKMCFSRMPFSSEERISLVSVVVFDYLITSLPLSHNLKPKPLKNWNIIPLPSQSEDISQKKYVTTGERDTPGLTWLLSAKPLRLRVRRTLLRMPFKISTDWF